VDKPQLKRGFQALHRILCGGYAAINSRHFSEDWLRQAMAEILFYHLTEQSLEQVLPGLLEKCLERSWKVIVQADSEDRCKRLDEVLWTFRNTAFLPHFNAQEASKDDDMAQTPILLTSEDDEPVKADVRFMIDTAKPPNLEGYTRAIYLFDGHDVDAVGHARTRWKAEKEAGHAITYWQQSPEGRWEKKA